MNGSFVEKTGPEIRGHVILVDDGSPAARYGQPFIPRVNVPKYCVLEDNIRAIRVVRQAVQSQVQTRPRSTTHEPPCDRAMSPLDVEGALASRSEPRLPRGFRGR